ncbi:MAG: chromosome segregation protein SMC [Candidatus Cyclonatronum sp.]|uniref:chromosome segregation protein SMC n=1 Tax=Cyclonatronum sp. TaxID=3024185 RepID=UPI0025C004B1|nr:chromosome segregation protein SMC [Cyclonatronum sp.]MCH8485487.1 chromosome segregation protein SMC [Cyclonatronum sp.]
MYLSELSLHGFKSFANKTTVRFDSGITGIVGPNGCGKSNIVDALRWVLGEQRASLLRSAAMQSVIFNGTATKKALGMAEVSITIQNNRGVLPVEYTEVTISRRLFRSGDSEYLLNGSVCRLKDIVELFMDTGIGPGAYSVIELKMVEEILNDKNNDRRRLFEEAAGVTRYKEKRKQTLRKLDETVADLQRVEDILVEIRKKTRSLQLQADKARKAKEFNERLEGLDLAWSKHEYDRLQLKLKPLVEQIVAAEREKSQLEQQYNALEEELVLAGEKLAERERAASEARREMGAAQGRYRETETTIRINREKISSEKQVILQFERDIEQAENDISGLKRSKLTAENILKEREAALLGGTEELDKFRDLFKNADLEAGELRRKVNNLAREQEALNNQINQIQSQKIRLESRVEGVDDDLQRMARQKEELTEELGINSKDAELLAAQLEKQRGEQQAAEAALAAIGQKREQARQRISDLKDELRAVQSRLSALESERELVEQIARSHESFPGSVRFLLEQKQPVTVLTDLFSTQQQFAVALEAALGDARFLLVAETQQQADEAFTLLKKENKGRAQIFVKDVLNERIRRNPELLQAEVHPDSLAARVSCDDSLIPLRNLLLSGIFLADSVEEASSRFSEDVSPVLFVTPDGELIRREGIIRSGSAEKNIGLRVGLKDRLTKLESQIQEQEAAFAQGSITLEKTNEELASLDETAVRSALREAEAAVRKSEQRLAAVQSEKQLYERNLAEILKREEGLDTQIGQTRAQLRELQPQLDEVKYRLDQVIEEQLMLRNELRQKEEARQRAQQSMNDARVKEQRLRSEAESYQREIEQAGQSITTIKERLDQRAGQARNSREKIESLRDQTEELEGHLEELDAQRRRAEAAFRETEEATARQRGRIRELEDQARQLQRKKEVNTNLLHQLQIEQSKLEMAVSSVSDHIWQTYGKMMEQIESSLPEDTEPAEVKQEIQKLRERLRQIGEVNPLAIDEYEEEKERLDFYETQVSDLHEAETKLRQTIKEINDTANERFQNTFEQIRENFKRVFSMLFMEDDFCDLILEERSDDPLDHRIEIIAKPRGKRPSNIEQLSGGEKTLTAIALLFAIYLVKPSPFCILDEVDAPLDDANVDRFTSLIRQFSRETQFIVITHNKKTMEKAEVMYGVTMQETGVSRLVGVRLDGVERAKA